jgi:cation diffusion facilitator CzcD-associated flavoprotein CzcO
MTAVARIAEIDTTVAVIGAGPYGLSVAAHLQARGVAQRTFGIAMETWRSHMPRGMHLKSEGFASNLSDPAGAYTLRNHCAQHEIPYADVGVPVKRDTFVEYGVAFQRAFVPDLDARKIVALERCAGGFVLRTDDGGTVRARRVVVAVGLSYFAWMPAALAALPESHVTHASAHDDLAAFRGRRVTVLGAGASALDVAALLHEAGAVTQLVAHSPHVIFHDPQSGLGPNVKSYAYSHFPDVFAAAPPAVRAKIVRGALGPSGCWFTKDQIVGNVRMHLGMTLDSARVANDLVCLRLRDQSGRAHEIESDHVIAGTGYRVDVTRIPFLTGEIVAGLRTYGGSPMLDRNFESSVPGLHFVGIAAALTFGPLLRFAYGARFAARRVSAGIAREQLGAGSARPAHA